MCRLKKIGWAVAVVGFLWILGCARSPEPQVSEFILKTSVLSISSDVFSEELDLKRAAYPYNIKAQPTEYNEMVIHLVKGLSEEIVLLSAAKDIGVVVTDPEVDLAEAEMKKDYPDDTFDQMLLKNAISYSLWKKRFKKNMIIERLIDQELKQKIEISSQDIVEFYKKNSSKGQEGSKEKIQNFQDENLLVSRLRTQKTQDAYDAWIQKLWEKYPVDIDKEKLKIFLIDTDNE